MHVIIFTDGAAQGNPGPGGYGVILKYGERIKELSGGFKHTTNNRMELMAVIVGLEALKKDNLHVLIASDSRYVIDSVEKGWLFDWVKKDFKGKKNKDLWLRFLEVYKKHKVKFKWIEGHNGHPQNERCDELAVAAARGHNLQRDAGFEDGVNN